MDVAMMIHNTAAEAVQAVLAKLIDTPLPAEIHGMYAEAIGGQIVLLNPEFSLIYGSSRKLNYRYMTAEALWNIANRNDVGFLRRYFSGVDNFVSDQEQRNRNVATWAYGPHLNSQIRLAFEELKSDPTSRRAIVTTRVFPMVQGTPPCLSSVQWFIRNEELIQVTTMRSNDAWLGLPLDLYQFGCWHRMMSAALKVPLGPYIHNTGSLHLYSRDLSAATEYLETPNSALAAPVFGEEALLAALRDVPGNMVEMHGHKMYADEEPVRPDYDFVAPGLKPYVALLLGDYGNIGESFNTLRTQGAAIGF